MLPFDRVGGELSKTPLNVFIRPIQAKILRATWIRKSTYVGVWDGQVVVASVSEANSKTASYSPSIQLFSELMANPLRRMQAKISVET